MRSHSGVHVEANVGRRDKRRATPSLLVLQFRVITDDALFLVGLFSCLWLLIVQPFSKSAVSKWIRTLDVRRTRVRAV